MKDTTWAPHTGNLGDAYATALGETTLDETIATVRAERDRRRELGYDAEDQEIRLVALLRQRLAMWVAIARQNG